MRDTEQKQTEAYKTYMAARFAYFNASRVRRETAERLTPENATWTEKDAILASVPMDDSLRAAYEETRKTWRAVSQQLRRENRLDKQVARAMAAGKPVKPEVLADIESGVKSRQLQAMRTLKAMLTSEEEVRESAKKKALRELDAALASIGLMRIPAKKGA